MFIDPIVQEVRAAREKIAAECDYDYHKILLHGQEMWERYKDQFKIVSKAELDRLHQLHNPPQ
ncbi:MAG: hypothetical protein ABSG67_01220 [Thermoguttaceae bacterium]|jgi:hypothetical protein